MRLPAPLLRLNCKVHKNTFGHVLILSGSQRMLGAAVLASSAAMRAGAGLVTLGLPKDLNKLAQKKIPPVVMTWPLPQTHQLSLSSLSYRKIQKEFFRFQVLAIGPGLSQHPSTQKLVYNIIKNCNLPMVIDADALTILSKNTDILKENNKNRILTPHIGEMARLTGLEKRSIQSNRKKIAEMFVRQYPCTLLLKSHQTIVSKSGKKTYINATGNAGLATAGSGDVLTGIIAAFLAQGLSPFDAAKWGAFVHGKAADIAVLKKTKTAMIATDIIECLPAVFKKL